MLMLEFWAHRDTDDDGGGGCNGGVSHSAREGREGERVVVKKSEQARR